MSLLSRPRLVMIEIAIAAALIAVAFGGVWLPVGAVVAVVCLALALVWVRRRALYLVVRSWLGMKSRRSRLRGQGIASLVGGHYEIVTVPAAGGGVGVGAIRDATTWSIPLAVPLMGVFNDDPPIPLDRLATLLTVEDVPLSSVRLVTLTAPASASSGPAGPVTPAARLAMRHLVLTLDTVHAADVIAERGGPAAIHQILRRCVMRAEEVLTSSGIEVRRLPDSVVAVDSASSLGPVSPGPDGTLPAVSEAMTQVRLNDHVSTTYAVSGAAALARLDEIAALLPAPIVATSVVLRPGRVPRQATLELLLRLSGQPDVVRAAEAQLRTLARQFDLRTDKVAGEQVPMLKATTLLGVAMEAA